MTTRPDPGDDNSVAAILRRAGPFMGLGMTMAASLGLLMGGGYWADRKLGTLPWLTLAGAVMGMVVGFYHLFDTLRRYPPR